MKPTIKEQAEHKENKQSPIDRRMQRIERLHVGVIAIMGLSLALSVFILVTVLG